MTVFQSLNNVRSQTLGATTVLADAPQKPDLLTPVSRNGFTGRAVWVPVVITAADTDAALTLA